MKRKFKFNYKPNFKPNFKSLSYLIVGIVMGILISAPLSLANNPIKLLVNGQEVQCLVSPQNVNGYVMVSIRDIATALGFEIGWDGEQNAVVVTSIKVETTKPVAPNVNVNPTQDVVKDNNKSATSVTETIITPEADNPKPPVTSSVLRLDNVGETTYKTYPNLTRKTAYVTVTITNVSDKYIKSPRLKPILNVSDGRSYDSALDEPLGPKIDNGLEDGYFKPNSTATLTYWSTIPDDIEIIGWELP